MKQSFPAILFSLILAVSQPAQAQQPAVKPLKFEALTINEGLSQGLILCMLQDRYGFMWFGTKDGLNRYDGYSFKVYRSKADDSTSLTGNFVQALYEDAAGRLWIGTATGMNLFERESETFRRFTHDAKDINTIASDQVAGFSEDQKGNLLIMMPYVIDRLTISENKGARKFNVMHSVKHPYAQPRIYKKRDGSYYLTALVGERVLNDLWLDSFPNLRMKSATPDAFKESKPFNYWFVAFDTVSEDTYFSNSKNLVRLHPSGAMDILCSDCLEPNPFWSPVLLDTSGVLLVHSGTDNDYFHFDIRTGAKTQIMPWDKNHNNALYHTNLIYKDRSGMLWFGSNGFGILKHNTLSESFHHTDHYSIIRMMISEDGNIIVNNDFISKDVFEKERRIEYDAAAAKHQKHWGGFTETSAPTYFTKQRRWFSTDSLLVCYDQSGKLMDEWTLPVKQILAPVELVQCIYDDEKQYVWVGTSEGLLRLNINDKTWKQYVHMQGDTTSLRANTILSILPGKDDFLWIGTEGGGLHLMNTHTEKFTSYTTADGLPNDVVYGILDDDDGNIWLSTNKGLSRFNPEKKTFKNFEEKDGLQSNEFNRKAYCKTHDGWLFFGGVNGFNYFDPKEIRDNKFIPQTLITDLKIRNKPVSFREPNSPLSKPAYMSHEITLPYSENMISFEFAAMDFNAPAKNMFQYKMEGFDKNWIHSGTNHFATYTNLDPGHYTFTVKGSNNDGVWDETGVSFAVTILPPWYMTWWFRTLVVAALAGIVYSIYRYRLTNALRLQEVRNRIAQDLHDEIGSNLSTISIFTDMAISKSKSKSETVTPLLGKINDYTQTSMEAMSDIVWMINSRNDQFENIIVHMRAHAAELLEAKNIELHMSFDEELNSQKLGMGERKNFYLIYKEALNNTVKYAECKNVWIEMKLEHSAVHLKIKDDGKGFDVALPQRGNGLINMQKRAEMLKGNLKIESQTGNGTTVTLQFSI